MKKIGAILVLAAMLSGLSGCEKSKVPYDVEQSTSFDGQTTVESQTTEPQTIEEITTEQPVTIKTLEDRAYEILDNMTLEEKVGQMFIARCPKENGEMLANKYHLGGYILFGRDFKNKSIEEVKDDIISYKNATKIPMLIGVDEEGGIVNRVSSYSQFREEPFKSPQTLYAEGGMELIVSDTAEKCDFLQSFGINMNFAPVADVSVDSADFIYDRTFGKDAEATAEYISEIVSVMGQKNMIGVLKHFPGYGDNEDTHTGIVYDERSYDSFLNSDFLPFEAGIDAGADVVMVAHNIVYCMDDIYPASLSLKVHKILREELGFEGVIITDELSMDGVKDFAEDERIAVFAVQAGNDLLCCTEFETQIQAVIKAVENGEITEERINESVFRIILLKLKRGIIQ